MLKKEAIMQNKSTSGDMMIKTKMIQVSLSPTDQVWHMSPAGHLLLVVKLETSGIFMYGNAPGELNQGMIVVRTQHLISQKINLYHIGLKVALSPLGMLVPMLQRHVTHIRYSLLSPPAAQCAVLTPSAVTQTRRRGNRILKSSLLQICNLLDRIKLH